MTRLGIAASTCAGGTVSQKAEGSRRAGLRGPEGREGEGKVQVVGWGDEGGRRSKGAGERVKGELGSVGARERGVSEERVRGRASESGEGAQEGIEGASETVREGGETTSEQKGEPKECGTEGTRQGE